MSVYFPVFASDNNQRTGCRLVDVCDALGAFDKGGGYDRAMHFLGWA